MKPHRLNQLILFLLLLVVMLGPSCDVTTCLIPPPAQRLPHDITSDLSLSPCTETYQLSANSGTATPLASTSTYDAFGLLLKLPSGRMLSIYRQAKTHDEDRGIIVQRASDDGGVHWSAPRALFGDPVLDSRSVSGGVLPSGAIVVFWNTYDFIDGHTSRSRVYFSRSTDGGVTWSDASLIPGRHQVYGPLIVTPDRIAMCLSSGDSNQRKSKVYLYFSFDDGATWTCHRRVSNAGVPYLPTEEDAFVWLGGDKILGFGRNGPNKPLLRFYSPDMGLHWDIQETGLGANSTPNMGWQVISPWVVKPSTQLPQVQIWWGERIQLSPTVLDGNLHSLLIDSSQVISAPHALQSSAVVFSVPTFNFGYPSVALTGNGRYLVQFYAGTSSDPPDLFLLPGTYMAQCGN